jgi:preprotein translocase subunit SecA
VDPIISYKKEGFDMFDEMVERIQRTTISTLLKVRIEARPAPVQVVRGNAPAAQVVNGGAAPAPAQAAPARPFRRQMPSPLSSMSSFKEAQERAQQNNNENK